MDGQDECPELLPGIPWPFSFSQMLSGVCGHRSLPWVPGYPVPSVARTLHTKQDLPETGSRDLTDSAESDPTEYGPNLQVGGR